jgi:hypothetical protein
MAGVKRDDCEEARESAEMCSQAVVAAAAVQTSITWTSDNLDLVASSSETNSSIPVG